MRYRHALIEKRSPKLFFVASEDLKVEEFTSLTEAKEYCRDIGATEVDLCDCHGQIICGWEMVQ